MKYFYSHLIEIESLTLELDKLGLSDHEKLHLAKLIDSNIHHTVLDVILSELDERDKKIFLDLLQQQELGSLNNGDHDKIRKHLNERIENVEEKIKKAADELKLQLHKDIKESKEF